MSEKNKYIYLLLHIPKTAGYTLKYHIIKNLRNNEYLELTYDNLGLDSNKPHLEYREYKEAAVNFLSSLSQDYKKNLKIVYGHLLPYGIHELFDKEPRYFTFIRNPVDRTVSLYNFLLNKFQEDKIITGKRCYYKLTLLVNGKIPTFETWLRYKYDSADLKGFLTASGYLKLRGYIEGNISNPKSISDGLKKFYFVGITENYREESLYIYEQLGFKKYFIDQNISNKMFRLGDKEVLINKIIRKNKIDNTLYKCAVLENRKFKRKNKEYINIVNRKKIERGVILPFTQLIYAPRQSIIRLSQKLLKNEPIYSNSSYLID